MGGKWNTPENNRKYYEENRLDINRKRRQRYAEDPDYAERKREQSRQNEAKKTRLAQEKRAEAGEKQPRRSAVTWMKIKVGNDFVHSRMYQISHLAARMSRKSATLRTWERQKVLPKAMFRDKVNRRLYTEDQVRGLVMALGEVMSKAKGHRYKTELRDAFHQVWKSMPRGVNE